MLPCKLSAFACYWHFGDSEPVWIKGIDKVMLPKIAFTEEGIIASPLVIVWQLLDSNALAYFDGAQLIELRGSMQYYDDKGGAYKERCLKVLISCGFQEISLGEMSVATKMGTSVKFKVKKLAVHIDDEECLNIDCTEVAFGSPKMNQFRVFGEEYEKLNGGEIEWPYPIN